VLRHSRKVAAVPRQVLLHEEVSRPLRLVGVLDDARLGEEVAIADPQTDRRVHADVADPVARLAAAREEVHGPGSQAEPDLDRVRPA
jgi:hypothetical protein